MAMTDRNLLELIAANVIEIDRKVVGLETRMDNLETKVDNLDTRMDKMDSEIQEIKKTVINIENNHGEKLAALFDGYYQHTGMLERIKLEVSRQEEVILRKIQ